MSYYKTTWENFNLSFRWPKYYWYLDDNCSYCVRLKAKVPFLSSCHIP